MSWLAKLRPWLVPAVALVVVVLLAVAWNRSRTQARTLEREREAARLEAAGLAVAHELERKEMAAQIALLTSESRALRAELAKAQAAAPGARPVAVVSGTTGPQRVSSPASTSSPPVVGPPATACPTVPCPGCHLADGEGLEIRVKGIALETRNGNLVAVGVAQAIVHHVDGNEWPLVEAPLQLEVGVLPRAEPPGWGVGAVAVGTAGTGGGVWWIGPLASPPPLRVFGADLSVLLGGGAGPAGAWGGLAGALVRW